MLKNIEYSHLDMILKWRNHPDIRAVMRTDHEISVHEHLAWFNSVRNDSTKKVVLYCYQDDIVGVVQYFNINNITKECWWGFYLNNYNTDTRKRLRYWFDLEKDAISYARDYLRCESLLCEVFDFNTVVLDVHKRFGFRQIRTTQTVKNNILHNLIVMSLDIRFR